MAPLTNDHLEILEKLYNGYRVNWLHKDMFRFGRGNRKYPLWLLDELASRQLITLQPIELTVDGIITLLSHQGA